MKIKTSELIGTQLDWAVATCEGYSQLRENPHEFNNELIMNDPRGEVVWFHQLKFSSNWALVGPIIEREGIEINVRNWLPSPGCRLPGKYEWSARLCYVRQTECKQFGPTPFIAAMRCYVISKLGYEVEIPEELK